MLLSREGVKGVKKNEERGKSETNNEKKRKNMKKTHTPPKTIKMTVTAGPIAIAASAFGAAAPTASPIAVEVSASSDSTPQNLANRAGDGLSPAEG